jgi:hypothetical protein
MGEWGARMRVNVESWGNGQAKKGVRAQAAFAWGIRFASRRAHKCARQVERRSNSSKIPASSKPNFTFRRGYFAGTSMFHGLRPIRGFGGSGGGASSVQIGRQELRMLARNVSPDTVSALKSFLSLTTLSLSELTAEHSICNGEFSRPVSCYRKTPLSMKYLPRRKSNWSRSDFHQVITHVRWNKFPSRAARCSRRQ